MIAPDTNLLLYAYSPESAHHKAARAWLEKTLSGYESVGFPLPVLHAFIRLLTHPTIAGRIVTLESALDIVDDWLALPQVSVLLPGDGHWRLLKSAATEGHAAANLFPDAAIAAIAIEHGATVHTNDRDFARFPGLRWHNPLTPTR